MTNYKKSKFSLDEKIENSKFNYCKNLKWFLIAPVAIILVGVIILCTLGFNLGIDFTGGSNMTIFVDKDATYVEEDYALDINSDLGAIENKINKVLNEYGLSVSTLQKTTMSDKEIGLSNGDAVIVKYQNDNSLETKEIESTNDEIRLALLKEFGFVDNSVTLETLEYEANKGLVANGGVTTASASAELMMKSFIALIVAVVLILIYVAFRFELTSGLAAILALFHDVLVTASVMLICRVEVNVAFIAALITILGYSINNTIIIFDQMRQTIKSKADQKFSNEEVANSSVKQTMTRSILTTLTTFIMIFMVTVIGVADIREFAFPIMIGIVAGFYSSVFLTPGLWAIAYRHKKKKKPAKIEKKEEIVVE